MDQSKFISIDDFKEINEEEEEKEEKQGKKKERKKKGEEKREEVTLSDFDCTAWESLNLPTQILNAIKELGFSEPTEIQQKVLPLAMTGKDIIAAAETVLNNN